MADSTKTIIIGSMAVYRGTYTESTVYYKENVVTYYSCVFKAASNNFSGVPPINVGTNGAITIVNTNYWTCVVDNSKIYNMALSCQNVDNKLSPYSENPIQNKAVYAKFNTLEETVRNLGGSAIELSFFENTDPVEGILAEGEYWYNNLTNKLFCGVKVEEESTSFISDITIREVELSFNKLYVNLRNCSWLRWNGQRLVSVSQGIVNFEEIDDIIDESFGAPSYYTVVKYNDEYFINIGTLHFFSRTDESMYVQTLETFYTIDGEGNLDEESDTIHKYVRYMNNIEDGLWTKWNLNDGNAQVDDELDKNSDNAISNKAVSLKFDEFRTQILESHGINIQYFSDYNEADNVQVSMLPFKGNGGVIVYLVKMDVFALYVNGTYYVEWFASNDRPAHTEFNILTDDGYKSRPDRLFCYTVEAQSDKVNVDSQLNTESSNPISNSAVATEFNNRLPLIGNVSMESVDENGVYHATCNITLDDVITAFNQGRRIVLVENDLLKINFAIAQVPINSLDSTICIAVGDGCIYQINFANNEIAISKSINDSGNSRDVFVVTYTINGVIAQNSGHEITDDSVFIGTIDKTLEQIIEAFNAHKLVIIQETMYWNVSAIVNQCPLEYHEEIDYDLSLAVMSLNGQIFEIHYTGGDVYARPIALSQNEGASVSKVAQRLEDNEVNINALFQMIKALDDKVKLYNSEQGQEPDPDDPVPFDPKVGNIGTVVINKDPENITASDVENALTLTPLADNLPVGMKIYEVAAEGSGQTADVYFKPGNTSAAKTYNTNLLAELCKATGDYADCAGLHLDQVYYIKRDAWVSSLSAALVDNGIPIEKDFIIDGEVNGVATGGFSTTSHFFYTRHSLNLNKAIFETTNNQGYYAFCIDAVLGIDQVVVTGCKFLISNVAGKHFTFVARDQSPLDQDGILVENNCVGDVLFQDNEFDGANVIYQGWSKRSSYFRTYTQDEEDGQGGVIPALQNNISNVLFKNSFRFIGNTVGNALTTPMVGMGVSLGTANENAGEYDTLKAYTSCPLWMAGNTFQGKKGLARASSSGYYTALLAEFSKVYFLHNSISDLIAAQNVYDYTNSNGTTTRTSASHYVYDLYASVTQLFCCNNTFRNLAKLTNDHTYFGIVKGKGVCIPGRYTAEHMPVERLYFGNEYTVNNQEITAYWNQRTYPQNANGYDYTPMIDYDNTVNINNVLSIKFTSGAWNIPIETFLFKQNTINAPLLETIANDGYGAEHFILEDNEFNTPAIKDDVHQYLFAPESCKEILFRNNTFEAIPSSRKFFFIEYQQSAGRPTITFSDNNVFPQGVTHVIARFFCRTTSQYENVEVSINGKYDPYATEVESSTAPIT